VTAELGGKSSDPSSGGLGVFVDDSDDLDETLETAIDHGNSTLVEIFTDSDPI
jgi:hypothetical protein